MTILAGTTGDEVAGLFELMRLRRAASRAFDPLGFTLYEAMLLLHVSRGVEQPHALIKALDVQATAVSALLTKLVRDGLVRRSAGKQDGRNVLVRLTPRGRDAVRRIAEAWVEQNAEPS